MPYTTIIIFLKIDSYFIEKHNMNPNKYTLIGDYHLNIINLQKTYTVLYASTP